MPDRGMCHVVEDFGEPALDRRRLHFVVDGSMPIWLDILLQGIVSPHVSVMC